LPGFTTGSGCLAPALSAAVFNACRAGNYAEAERIQARFLGVEDLRDEWGPARVLHHAVELGGIADMGPIPPFVSELSLEQKNRIKPAVQELLTEQQELVSHAVDVVPSVQGEWWSRQASATGRGVKFLGVAGGSALLGGAGFLSESFPLAASERVRAKISDIQTMTLSGARTYVFVKVVTDDGHYGIAEAYGTPSIGVKEQVQALKPLLVGKNPLEIDAIYTYLGIGGPELSGTRTDGSAHSLMRAASGIEMALWDLAGKILGVPTTTLLGGKFRDQVRVYDHAAPHNMLTKHLAASGRKRSRQILADLQRTSSALLIPNLLTTTPATLAIVCLQPRS